MQMYPQLTLTLPEGFYLLCLLKKLKELKINDKSLVKKHNSSTFMTWSSMLCQDVSPQGPQRVTIPPLTTQFLTSPARLPTHVIIAAKEDNAFCAVKWTPGMGLFSSFHRGQHLSNEHDFWPEKKKIILISGQEKPLWKTLEGGKEKHMTAAQRGSE